MSSELGRSIMQDRLGGLVTVSECRGWWYKGFFIRDRLAHLEMSFEPVDASIPTFPMTHLTYLAIWKRDGETRRSLRTLFEFQLGSVCTTPDETTLRHLLTPLVHRLSGYRPMQYVNDDDQRQLIGDPWRTRGRSRRDFKE